LESQEFSHLRKALNKTQKEVATLLGTSLKAVHSYEQGWRTIPVHVERQMLFLYLRRRGAPQKPHPCWKVKRCPADRRSRCPAWEFRAGTLCWFISGTICGGAVQRHWREKIAVCRHCEVLAPLLPMLDNPEPPCEDPCHGVDAEPWPEKDTEAQKMNIVSIATSRKKGTRKHVVDEAVLIPNHGIQGDAHAGSWHRQVSFLAAESIEKARQSGLQVTFGDFAENIATSGIEWTRMEIGTRLQIGRDAVVEVTQIGKECHTKCAIYYLAGDCIMPREGVFARVLQGGKIRSGDPIRVVSLPATRCPS
jgi:MOSC domain-containing protein YiiM/DNA-binding XRE family transcriptional regulator